MPKYSRGHEREECTKMWRGFWHSTFGILFCWVPILGLVLSISGFARQVVRMTVKYRKRMALFTLYGLLSLVISIGAIVGGLYAYSRNPNILQDSATWAWTKLTGQPALPGQTPPTDYTGQSDPGLGVFTTNEGDMTSAIPEEDLVEGDEVPDDAALNKGVNDDGASFEDDEDDDFEDDDFEDDDFEDDEDEEEELPELDFMYEVLDQEEIEQGEDISTIYKVSTDKEELTDEDLLALFKDVTYEDGYYLHYVHVFKPNSDYNEPYDVAAVEEEEEGELPIITRAPETTPL